MAKKLLSLSSLVLSSLLISACASDVSAPTVVSTSPENESTVEASTTELSVTFSEKMTDHSWSFTYQDESKFPALAGEPWYSEDLMTVTLPVTLEPGKDYEIWLNSVNYDGFRDAAGNTLEPYQWSFSTKE